MKRTRECKHPLACDASSTRAPLTRAPKTAPDASAASGEASEEASHERLFTLAPRPSPCRSPRHSDRKQSRPVSPPREKCLLVANKGSSSLSSCSGRVQAAVTSRGSERGADASVIPGAGRARARRRPRRAASAPSLASRGSGDEGAGDRPPRKRSRRLSPARRDPPAMQQPASNGAGHLNGDAAPANGDVSPGELSQTDQEIVRLIGQHLNSIGLERSAAFLMQESGLELEHSAACTFRQHVLAGDWGKADHDLRALQELLPPRAADTDTLREMKFIVLEQKYLEHLESGRALDALHVLRNELTPLQHDTARVHRLSALMMCAEPEELHARAAWPGAGPESRDAVLRRVQAVLPPSLMMAPARLRALLGQAAQAQAARCRYHLAARPASPPPIPFTLLLDHRCPANNFPIHPLQRHNSGIVIFHLAARPASPPPIPFTLLLNHRCPANNFPIHPLQVSCFLI
ncbi:unnamed protein product [Plutella xylostella]|uniref:(diamondback moth) hypothetical protein n=1 Tax=Plutella xylostella TaxID=51655 RepID=A0A8S4EF23_PLUXY|nr:unnamed protein product [Plutella xylostella]